MRGSDHASFMRKWAFFKYGNRIAAGMRKNDPSSGHHPSAVQRLSGEKHGKASLWNHSRRGG